MLPTLTPSMKFLYRGAVFLIGVSVAQAMNHVYKPDRYSLFFTSDKEPVLRLRPADTVETTSVDSEGNDETGKSVGPKYNALTGPFYVEGAKPGDTLVVRLERVRLNSRRGIASTRIADSAITPQEFAKGAAGAKGYYWSIDAPIAPQDFARNSAGGKGYHWNFDLESQTGSTDVTPRLSRLRLPLRPFPGCIGVAPALQETL